MVSDIMAIVDKHPRFLTEGLRFQPRLPGQDHTPKQRLSLNVAPGETVVLVGPAGSGKTDMALRLAGLDETNHRKYRVLVDGEDLYDMTPVRRAESMALIPSTVDLLFSCITSSLIEEMELCFEFLGQKADANSIRKRLVQFELSSLAERDPLMLSGGEKVRAAFAIALLKNPKVLIIDEAFEELDPVSEQIVRHTLDETCRTQRLAIIEIHSRPRMYVENLQQSWCFLLPNEVIQGTFEACWRAISTKSPDLLPPVPRLGARIEKECSLAFSGTPTSVNMLVKKVSIRRCSVPTDTSLKEAVEAQPGISEEGVFVQGLEFRYPGTEGFCLGPITHKFYPQRVTTVLGRNGSGKTTLLRCLGNLNNKWKGTVSLGAETPGKSDYLHVWAKSILYCFQNPDDQIFLATAREELLETARRTRDSSFPLNMEMALVADQLGLTEFLNIPPFDLPRSIRRLITLGSAFIARPRVLLLDEPTVALDTSQTNRLMFVLREYAVRGGTAVIVSHDYEFVAETADDIIVLDKGAIISSGSKEKGFPAWQDSVLPTVPHVAMELGLSRDVWREQELLHYIIP